MIERSLVLVKPDGVQRALIGRIIQKFEDAGLKIVGMKMVWVDMELAKKHYTDDLIPIVGGKTKTDWDKAGLDYKESVEELGQMIVEGTRKFLISSPVVAMVLEGIFAVEIVRKLVGSTGPRDSSPGTIRGDFAHLGLGYASIQRKSGANLVHASGNAKEAEHEIKLWFNENELHSYETIGEKHTFLK